MSFNKVVLLGRLGKDPELRYSQSQTAICKMTVATSDRRKDQSGQWSEHTEWHNVVTFGKTAENCAQYLQKGRQALIEGRIQTSKYQDKQTGSDRYWTEIIANTVQFVGGRGDNAGAPNDYAGAPAGSTASAAAPNVETSVSFDDDDIPF